MFNDTSLASLGTLRLVDVCASGQVQILARDRIRAGHVEVDGLHVIAADTRERPERPHGYGVRVVQGAFTLWNMQDDENVVITADLAGLAAGAVGKPVFGSGIFVSGAGDTGGRLVVSRLETDAVYSDACIPPGAADVISGGVFTVYGCWVDTVHNHGPVVTYGANDMVLDNWGTVDRWIAEQKITSYGPSGIGFVNFGVVNELRVERPIETFGRGARGFNVYTGTVRTAEFDRIVTHADGAVGIQISQPIGTLRVKRGIETFGGTGDSLVKGVVTRRDQTFRDRLQREAGRPRARGGDRGRHRDARRGHRAHRDPWRRRVAARGGRRYGRTGCSVTSASPAESRPVLGEFLHHAVDVRAHGRARLVEPGAT
jgi:hypothetical protein